MITDQKEIQSHALSFYEDLYRSESCYDTATDELLCNLSKLTEEERSELDRPLTWRDFTSCSRFEFWEVTWIGWAYSRILQILLECAWTGHV